MTALNLSPLLNSVPLETEAALRVPTAAKLFLAGVCCSTRVICAKSNLNLNLTTWHPYGEVLNREHTGHIFGAVMFVLSLHSRVTTSRHLSKRDRFLWNFIHVGDQTHGMGYKHGAHSRNAGTATPLTRRRLCACECVFDIHREKKWRKWVDGPQRFFPPAHVTWLGLMPQLLPWGEWRGWGGTVPTYPNFLLSFGLLYCLL